MSFAIQCNKLKMLFASESLKARATRGSLWLGTGNGAEQLLRFIRNMLLARILAPEAFGVMSIVLAVNTAFESLTEIGIRQAIIQSPQGGERTYLNGAWFLSCARSLILYTSAFTGAPYIALIYNNHELVLLLRVAFLTILFNGFISANAFLAVKKMKFKRWVIAWHGGNIIGVLISGWVVFYSPTVWALVIGFTSEALFRCLLSYILFPYTPKTDFDKKNIKSLLKFSGGMFGLPILTFVFLRADIFAIGKLCPMAELGLYSMASALAVSPFQIFTALGQVMMPAFAEKQNEVEWLNKWVLHISTFMLNAGLPLLLYLVFYGRDVLTLVYGLKYGEAALPFAIVFATQLIYNLGLPVATVYLAIGRPELHRLFAAIRAILMLFLLLPAIKFFGLSGAAAAGALSIFISYLIQVRRLSSLTGLQLTFLFKRFLWAAFASLGVAAVWLATKRILADMIIMNLLMGGVGCLLSCGLAYRSFFHHNQAEPQEKRSLSL